MVTHSRTPLRTHRLRPLNIPRPVTVELNSRGVPVAITEVQSAAFPSSGQEPSLHAPTPGVSPGFKQRTALLHEVESVGETWRVDDEWWRQPLHRTYYELVLAGGKHTIVYHDLVTDQWFEQTP